MALDANLIFLKMPFFKSFKIRKDKQKPVPPKRASSMSNIYNDYSGNAGDKKDVTFEEDHQPEEQINGKF